MPAAIEQRLHDGQRPRAAGIEIRATAGVQLERSAEQARLLFLVSGGALHPDDMIIEGQHENAVLPRPLNEHLARARRRQQETHGVEKLTLADPLHATRQIEAKSGERGLPQRLLIDVERLLDYRRLGRADDHYRTRRIKICRGVVADVGGARELDPAPGLRDAALRLALQQEILETGEKALHLSATAALDKSERRVGDRDAVRRVYGVEKLVPRLAQFVVGLLDHRLVVPHRVVMTGRLLAFAIEIGEPAARTRRPLDAGQQ